MQVWLARQLGVGLGGVDVAVAVGAGGESETAGVNRPRPEIRPPSGQDTEEGEIEVMAWLGLIDTGLWARLRYSLNIVQKSDRHLNCLRRHISRKYHTGIIRKYHRASSVNFHEPWMDDTCLEPWP